MATRSFAITADDKPLALDDKGSAELTINVSNTSAKPIRGQAKLVPLGTTKLDWLRINGEVERIERNFAANEAQQFVIRITAPPGAPSGKYSFRVNVMSVQNPDDDYAEGPVVSFEMRTPIVAPTPKGKKFPWFYILLALVLVGGGITLALVLSGPASKLQAAFSANPSQGFAPLTVIFTNVSSGQFDETLWTFGDGAMVTNRDADHVFNEAGVYLVTLLVSGKKAHALATNTITVQEKAKASFIVSPNSGHAPLTVTLINQSTGDGLKWEWDFGNGNKSAERDPPTQIYPTQGNSTILLTAIGPDPGGGATNISTASQQVNVTAPSRAEFTANPTSGEAPLTVKFSDQSVGNPTSWLWQFGDGTSSSEKNPTHIYRDVRTYGVTLRVSGQGGEASIAKNALIFAKQPMRVVPNVINKSLADARKIILGRQLAVGKLNPVPFIVRMNKVVSQVPAPNTQVPVGTKVNLAYIP